MAAVIIPNLGSLVNGRITRDNLKPWFAGLKQPSFRPPNFLFAPVWITIYVAMGFASYLVYRDGGGLWTEKSRIPLLLYVIQLALNWAWTSIFFGYHSLKWVCATVSVELLLLITLVIRSIRWFQVGHSRRIVDNNNYSVIYNILIYTFQSLVEIIVLDIAVIACAIAFYRVNTTAGLLFIPYIAWLAYASVLNYALYTLNPDEGDTLTTESSNFRKEN